MSIFDYSWIADWSDRLTRLAEMIEPERWSYVSLPSRSTHPILDSYIKHTFNRIVEENKMIVTDRFSVFNTGLLTVGQEEVYGIFTISERFDPANPISPDNKKWFFRNWIRAGDRQLTELPLLPQMASYWSDASDLVFNPALHVELNVDHIIRDNLTRFPVELGGRLGADGVPLDFLADDGDEVDPDDAPPAMLADDIPLLTRNALDGAMKHSIRLAQRSYRLAVPQYYMGRLQLLLPLYLRNTGRADLALTLEKHGDWYRAATVLYPDWAFRHARLLTRPNSEWLGGFRTDLR
jgi:hypothetical protein